MASLSLLGPGPNSDKLASLRVLGGWQCRRACRLALICWIWHNEFVKPIVWVGSSLEDLRKLPKQVQREVGFALGMAQRGEKGLSVKPLKGFGGASVLEVVENHVGNTYRAVYTVKFRDAIYVLHVFQKKSKKGIATPKTQMDVVRRRLQWAVERNKGR